MNPLAPTSQNSLVGRHILLQGNVQGIGLRPAVARWASDCGICGFVTNDQQGVAIHVEGSPAQVGRFTDGLLDHLPLAADVHSLRQEFVGPLGYKSFDLDARSESTVLATRIPADKAVCHTCLKEINDQSSRRANYAMTSCTECGPRFTIIETMPYERPRTSMADFDLCQHCTEEYESLNDRRFHAETNCCSHCGPHVWCTNTEGIVLANENTAIEFAARFLAEGKIIALRGIGGYQLLVDATQETAVERLRMRKRRPQKPLAVMVRSLSEIERIAKINETERIELASVANPIVILQRAESSDLTAGISPGVDTVGVMLASTPLHWQLLNSVDRPVVATSGNVEGCPLAYDIGASQQSLSAIADLWLHHNRRIVRPIDDSVRRIINNRPVSVRLGRGLAPLSLDFDSLQSPGSSKPPAMLAVGGHTKSAVAIFNGEQAILGPHIGELEGAAARERWIESTLDLCKLYGAEPERLICDQHPGYFTTNWSKEQDIPVLAVQHHHAHIVAGMVEHGWLDREVLGIAFDGTGYGSDGTIWGGEVLRATATDFERIAHLRPFRLAGGRAAVQQPWRIAVELVRQAIDDKAARSIGFADITSKDTASIFQVLGRPQFSPLTSSMGRLFDGITALALDLTHVQFEAQAAMQLESICDPMDSGQYELPLRHGSCIELDWRPLVAAVFHDRIRSEAPGVIAMRFHRAVANAIVEIVERFSPLPVVLAGGVFQNRVLTELIAERWPSSAGPLGLPGRFPPGDGGLAAGQLAVAIARLFRQRA